MTDFDRFLLMAFLCLVPLVLFRAMSPIAIQATLWTKAKALLSDAIARFYSNSKLQGLINNVIQRVQPMTTRLYSALVEAFQRLVNVMVSMTYSIIRRYKQSIVSDLSHCPSGLHPDNLQPWLLDMAKMLEASSESKSSDVDLTAFRRRGLVCDNDECGKTNPRMQCLRCQSAYFCSPQCQRVHWRQQAHRAACQSAVQQKSKWKEDMAELLACNSVDAMCGICLESRIDYPFVLPNCRHVFCLSCIRDYQATTALQTESNAIPCPFCRAKFDGNLNNAALKMAHLMRQRLEMLLDDNSNAGRLLCDKIILEMDEVSKDECIGIPARYVRATVLRYVDPRQAVRSFQTLREGIQTFMGADPHKSIRSMIARAQEQGLVQHAQDLTEISNSLPLFDWQCQAGLALSFETASLYQEALAEYQSLQNSAKGTTTMPMEAMCKVKHGMARSYYHLGKYEHAIDSARSFVVSERHVAGGHGIVAETLLAMAEQSKTSGAVVIKGNGKIFSATVTDAVTVMCNGILYEAQWNDKNKRANMQCLKELLGKVNVNGIAPNAATSQQRQR